MAASTTAVIAIEELPTEVLDLIIRKLSTKDVLRCCRLNRDFARLIKDGEYLFDDPGALRKLVKADRVDLLGEYLKRPGVITSTNINPAIRWASTCGRARALEMLLACDPQCIDPSTHNNVAIRLASRNGHIEVVRLLLARDDVDPSMYHNLSLQYANINKSV